MHCWGDLVDYLSWAMILAGLVYLIRLTRPQSSYGRYTDPSSLSRVVPAKVAWFLQELPALLVPLLMLLFTSKTISSMGTHLLLWTFCLHYFQRTFVYSLLTRGQPFPLDVMLTAGFFCAVNGFLQGHSLLHCARYDEEWATDYRFTIGLFVFFLGMAINVHSDCILRKLRKPGEVAYKIPKGGLFDYVSGANYFGEIVEWFGYAIATWSFPSLSFAIFSLCFIGSRAYHHHRYYNKKFKEYPKSRRALIPFIF